MVVRQLVYRDGPHPVGRSGARKRLVGPVVGAAVVGPWVVGCPIPGHCRGIQRGGSAGHRSRPGQPVRVHAARRGHRRAETPADPAVAARRKQVVPALQRARRRLRPRRACRPVPTATATRGSSTARRCGRRARQGGRVRDAHRPHRLGCPQAPGHLVLLLPDAPARRRGPARSTRSPARPTSTRCSSTTRGCPADHLVGPLDDGWRVLQTALAYERSVMGDLARGPHGPRGKPTRTRTSAPMARWRRRGRSRASSATPHDPCSRSPGSTSCGR